jgi:hypothetical protein
VLLLIGEVLGIIPLKPHLGILSHWLSKSMAGPRCRLQSALFRQPGLRWPKDV